jgi:guanylate cyclase
LRVISRVLALGANADDDDVTAQRKRLYMGSSTVTPALLGALGVVYVLEGEPVAGWDYITIDLWIWALIPVFLVTHNVILGFWLAAVPTLPAHLIAILALGDITHSGGIVLWGLAFPVATSVVFVPIWQMIPLFAMFVANLVVCTLIVPADRSSLSHGLEQTILVINLAGLSAFAVAILGLFVNERDKAHRMLREEQRRGRELLLSILPEAVADELTRAPRVIADAFEDVSVLFADVVGFTPMSEQLTPTELVELLDELFAHFDGLVDQAGLEKIKTIGDAYMVAAGIPLPRPDHATAIVELGLRMQATAEARAFGGRHLQLRIGVNSGSVVAGVIGRRKFSYDLWGDVVNTASRMESHGVPGRLHITEATHALVADRFDCESRGMVEIRGKGALTTWLVNEQRRPRPAPASLR